MTVRQATPDDLEDIALLITELADFERLSDAVSFERTELSRWLFGPDPAARVAIAEASRAGGSGTVGVAGFALWFRTFSTFLGSPGIWLEDLYVRPEYRGQGLGRELVHFVRSLTDGRVEWAVLDWNEPAAGFYRHLGALPLAGWTTYRWAPRVVRRPASA
jgi:GNAT superfamily N-acetyltransferase